MNIFKETEHEKINNELLNKLIPMEVLNGYYYFGFANALKYIEDSLNYDSTEIIDKKDIIELVKMINKSNPDVKEYYDRLKKESN